MTTRDDSTREVIVVPLSMKSLHLTESLQEEVSADLFYGCPGQNVMYKRLVLCSRIVSVHEHPCEYICN